MDDLATEAVGLGRQVAGSGQSATSWRTTQKDVASYHAALHGRGKYGEEVDCVFITPSLPGTEVTKNRRRSLSPCVNFRWTGDPAPKLPSV